MGNKDTRAAIRLDVLGLFLAGLNNTFLALLVAVFIHGPGTTANQPELLLRASCTSFLLHGFWQLDLTFRR